MVDDPRERLNRILIQLREPAVTREVAEALKREVEELQEQGISTDDPTAVRHLSRIRAKIDRILSRSGTVRTKRIQLFATLLDRKNSSHGNIARVAAIRQALQESGLAGSTIESLEEGMAFTEVIYPPLDVLLRQYKAVSSAGATREKLEQIAESTEGILDQLPEGVDSVERTLQEFLQKVRAAREELVEEEQLRGLLESVRTRLSREETCALVELDGLIDRIKSNIWYQRHGDDLQTHDVLESLNRHRRLVRLRQRIEEESETLTRSLGREIGEDDGERLATLWRRVTLEELDVPPGLRQALGAFHGRVDGIVNQLHGDLDRGLPTLNPQSLQGRVASLIQSLRTLGDVLKDDPGKEENERILEEAKSLQESVNKVIGDRILKRELSRIGGLSMSELDAELAEPGHSFTPTLKLLYEELRQFRRDLEEAQQSPDRFEGPLRETIERSINEHAGAEFAEQAREIIHRVRSARDILDSIEKSTPGSGQRLIQDISKVDSILSAFPAWQRAREVKGRLENQDRLQRISALFENPTDHNLRIARDLIGQMHESALAGELREALRILEECNRLLRDLDRCRAALEPSNPEGRIRKGMIEGFELVGRFKDLAPMAAGISVVDGFSKAWAEASSAMQGFYGKQIMAASESWLGKFTGEEELETIQEAQQTIEDLVSRGFDEFQGDRLRRRLEALGAQAEIKLLVDEGKVDQAWERFDEAKDQGILRAEEQASLNELLKLDGLMRKIGSGAAVDESEVMQTITEFGIRPRLLDVLVDSFLQKGDPSVLARLRDSVQARPDLSQRSVEIAELSARFEDGDFPELQRMLLSMPVSRALEFLGAVARSEHVSKAMAVLREYGAAIDDKEGRERVDKTAQIIEQDVDERVRRIGQKYQELQKVLEGQLQESLPESGDPGTMRDLIHKTLSRSEEWAESAGRSLREGQRLLTDLIRWNPKLARARPGALKSASERMMDRLQRNTRAISELRRVMESMDTSVGRLGYKIRSIATSLGDESIPSVTLAISLMNRYNQDRDALMGIIDRIVQAHKAQGLGMGFEEVAELKERVEKHYRYDFAMDRFGLGERLQPSGWGKTIEDLQGMALEIESVDRHIQNIRQRLQVSTDLESRVSKYHGENDPKMRERHRQEIGEILGDPKSAGKSLLALAENVPDPSLSEVARRNLEAWAEGQEWKLVQEAVKILRGAARGDG